MSIFSRVGSSAFLALLLFAGVVAQAPAANILYSSTTGSIDTNNGATIGLDFTPTVDITVTHLGVLDGGFDGDGIQSKHDIGLWVETDPTTPLVTAIVDTNTTGILQHGYRFVPITPVVLTAGQTYVFGAYYEEGFLGTGDKLVVTLPPVVNPSPLANITLNARGTFSSSLEFPAVQPNSPDFILSANMLFTPVTPVGGGDGDVNSDLKVDAADVALASRIVIGNLTPSGSQILGGDIAPYVAGASQPDNEITLQDLILIIRIALGTFTL